MSATIAAATATATVDETRTEIGSTRIRTAIMTKDGTVTATTRMTGTRGETVIAITLTVKERNVGKTETMTTTATETERIGIGIEMTIDGVIEIETRTETLTRGAKLIIGS